MMISRTNYLSGLSGLSGAVEDAEAALARSGFKNADCKFIPYTGPFGGGTNVCDVGDGAGYAYGAELVARPGGVDTLKNDIRLLQSQVESGVAAPPQDWANRRPANLPPLSATPAPPAPPAPPPTPPTPPPASRDAASATTGKPNQSVPPRGQPGEVPATKPPGSGSTTAPPPEEPDNVISPMWIAAGLVVGLILLTRNN